ncbi:discoidin domain-containing protein [Saccharothrix longispora]|uniref:discoidin domain-containing protein n=1 Tax=Saccharothrix longispora TaxID=33920 RepID=UPI0028FD2CEF|nr:discoidin domain-containing protein [Saccharothrix longispora]MDU0292856.1 discoidin domain-containing protein [Saccharothrix longispora]
MSSTTRARSRLTASLLALSLTALTLVSPVAQGAPAAALVDDDDANTYWQTDSLPRSVGLDLGAPTRIDQVALSLPEHFGERDQTFSIRTSLDGKGLSTLVPSGTHTFRPAERNRVTFDVAPTLVRFVQVEVTANSADEGAQLAEVDVRRVVDAQAPLPATYTASSHADVYQAPNAGDGNQATYWESANNAFPQWLRADLGAAVKVDRVVLKTPLSGWGARTQTLAVQTSADGTSFSDLVPSAQHTFQPSANNTATIEFTSTTTRYLRLLITGNTGWPAGQISEFELHGSSGGDAQAPTAPTNLACTTPQSGRIRLTWNAATDNVGVTGYDVYANGQLRTSVAGSALSYTDTQPDGLAVTYQVVAKDAAGNQSPRSASVTRPGNPGPPGTNLAKGKPATADSHAFTFVAANAVDDDVNTYWEAAAHPGTLTTQLGANADVSSVTVKLNPSSAWGARTQNIQVLGREQGATGFTNLVSARDHRFDPASGNAVTIPLTARVADVRLRITSNTGAPGGQVAEFQVFGTAAPNPDLTVTGTSFTPAGPVETSAITLSATVRNAGTAASAATDVTFFLGSDAVGTAQVGALAAGASATATAAIGPRGSGSYQYAAKVDETKKVVEQDEANNARLHPSALVVTPVPSSDLVASVGWSPANPAAGQATAFTAVLRNDGSIATAGGAHGVTLTVLDGSGGTVRTLTGSYTGVLQPGQSAQVALGSWNAANGNHTVRTQVAVDANEIAARQGNNRTDQSLFVGRGANVPWQHVEAEDGVTAGGATRIGPNRVIGDLAGEASGRRAVTLNATGQSVEFTTTAPTNTLVTRFSIPDSAGGGGIASTVNVYVNGTFHKALDLHSRHIWLYGNEASPGNSPSAGGPRHIYDEASTMLDGTFPAGTRIKLQKDAANGTDHAIDFVNFENAVAKANPDPARFVTPTGFGHQDVQNALDRFRMDTSGNLLGVYLPAGTYTTAQKFQVYGKPVQVVGAGPWFTKFAVPTTQENTDAGFRAESSVNGSVFRGFSFFGNYTSRIDGPGKVFDFANVSRITIDDIWAEHVVCLYWGANTDSMTIRNSRIRNTFADGVNMTNGSTDNLVQNIEARSTGDDSFALFSAIDAGGADEKNNVYENLTSLTTWRAAGLAVYGGFLNTFRNIHVADTLTYSGVTISSLDFGYPMNGFGPEPTTFSGITLVRTGGHFWGAQTFPGIWMFSASKPFRGIRVNDVDIVDPTYAGIMFQTKYNGPAPENPIQDTVLTNVSISGARLSGDRFQAKSGIGLWANEMPEANQGPAVGSVTFHNLRFSDNVENIRNRTSTFTINVNP